MTKLKTTFLKLKKDKTVFFIFLLFLLNGCASYTFNDQSYTSPEAALSAHKVFLFEIEKEIKPSNFTIKEDVIIITPSKITCEALGIIKNGVPAKSVTDYLGAYLEQDFAYFSNFLKKSKMFKSVDHKIEDSSLQYANKVKNDFFATIYFDMQSTTQASWFIMVSPDNIPKQINFDKMAKTGALRIQSWIDDVHKHFQEITKTSSIATSTIPQAKDENNSEEISTKESMGSNISSSPDKTATVSSKEATKPTNKEKKKIPKQVISQVQQQLLELSYAPGVADGMMGQSTVNAMKKFQQENNLAATGQIDTDTINMLKERLEKQPRVQTQPETANTLQAEEVASQPASPSQPVPETEQESTPIKVMSPLDL